MSVACPSVIAALDPGLCRAVDHYCERLGPGFDAEPVNALTNAAFLIAGYAAWRLWVARRAGGDGLIVAIVLVIPVIGLGSFLFHTLAVRWAEWGDVIPILIYMLLYLWLAERRFLGWPFWPSLLALAAFLAATLALEAAVPGWVLWGGAMYLPTLLVLISLGFFLGRDRPALGGPFLVAVGVFLLSFAARTVDMPLCDAFPLGTHFLWHLFNALLVYLLARVAILHAPRHPSPPVP